MLVCDCGGGDGGGAGVPGIVLGGVVRLGVAVDGGVLGLLAEDGVAGRALVLKAAVLCKIFPLKLVLFENEPIQQPFSLSR